jgi:hypothetical protein
MMAQEYRVICSILDYYADIIPLTLVFVPIQAEIEADYLEHTIIAN